MGEVNRWECAGEDLPRECPKGPCVDYADYARLERERDELLVAKSRLEHTHNEDARRVCEQAEELTRLRTERDQAMSAHADMVREIEASQAEFTRLRAVENSAGLTIEGARVARDTNGAKVYIVKAQDIKALAEACGRRGDD